VEIISRGQFGVVEEHGFDLVVLASFRLSIAIGTLPYHLAILIDVSNGNCMVDFAGQYVSADAANLLKEDSSKDDCVVDVAVEIGDVYSVLNSCGIGTCSEQQVLVGVAEGLTAEFAQETLNVHGRKWLSH
jgi:hypothetical protein